MCVCLCVIVSFLHMQTVGISAIKLWTADSTESGAARDHGCTSNIFLLVQVTCGAKGAASHKSEPIFDSLVDMHARTIVLRPFPKILSPIEGKGKSHLPRAISATGETLLWPGATQNCSASG